MVIRYWSLKSGKESVLSWTFRRHSAPQAAEGGDDGVDDFSVFCGACGYSSI
jgi:hypothetical protein